MSLIMNLHVLAQGKIFEDLVAVAPDEDRDNIRFIQRLIERVRVGHFGLVLYPLDGEGAAGDDEMSDLCNELIYQVMLGIHFAAQIAARNQRDPLVNQLIQWARLTAFDANHVLQNRRRLRSGNDTPPPEEHPPPQEVEDTGFTPPDFCPSLMTELDDIASNFERGRCLCGAPRRAKANGVDAEGVIQRLIPTALRDEAYARRHGDLSWDKSDEARLARVALVARTIPGQWKSAMLDPDEGAEEL